MVFLMGLYLVVSTPKCVRFAILNGVCGNYEPGTHFFSHPFQPIAHFLLMKRTKHDRGNFFLFAGNSNACSFIELKCRQLSRLGSKGLIEPIKCVLKVYQPFEKLAEKNINKTIKVFLSSEFLPGRQFAGMDQGQ